MTRQYIRWMRSYHPTPRNQGSSRMSVGEGRFAGSYCRIHLINFFTWRPSSSSISGSAWSNNSSIDVCCTISGSPPSGTPPSWQLKCRPSGVKYRDDDFQSLKSPSGRAPSRAVKERRWSSSSYSDPVIQKRGCPVRSSKTRQPKLQISRDLPTAPVSINSGERNPSGTTGFGGGPSKKYAVKVSQSNQHVCPH